MAAVDIHSGFLTGISGPVVHAFAITPSNDDDITYATRYVYVGGTGTLKVDTVGGETVTFSAVAAGVFHPIRVTKVYATGTDATGIIGAY